MRSINHFMNMFSAEEMHDFIIKTGKYDVVTKQTWESHNIYHNDTEIVHTDVTMYINKFSNVDLDDFLKRNETYNVKLKYGLEKTFREEMKEKLLNL